MKDLVKDFNSTVYTPELNKITGSVTATLLLMQMIYWWDKQKGKKFYKFKEPCNHSLYKSGDSWTEELNISRTVFDTALKKIGYKKGKTKKGKNRTEENSYIIYFTDKNGLTWYSLNGDLLRKDVNKLYNEKRGNEHTQKSGNNDLQLSETTSKTTTETTPQTSNKLEVCYVPQNSFKKQEGDTGSISNLLKEKEEGEANISGRIHPGLEPEVYNSEPVKVSTKDESSLVSDETTTETDVVNDQYYQATGMRRNITGFAENSSQFELALLLWLYISDRKKNLKNFHQWPKKINQLMSEGEAPETIKEVIEGIFDNDDRFWVKIIFSIEQFMKQYENIKNSLGITDKELAKKIELTGTAKKLADEYARITVGSKNPDNEAFGYSGKYTFNKAGQMVDDFASIAARDKNPQIVDGIKKSVHRIIFSTIKDKYLDEGKEVPLSLFTNPDFWRQSIIQTYRQSSSSSDLSPFINKYQLIDSRKRV